MECIGGTPLIALWGGRHCHSFPPLAQQHHLHQEHHHHYHQQHHHHHQQNHLVNLISVLWFKRRWNRWCPLDIVQSLSSKSAGVNRDLSGHLVWWIAHQYQQCLKPRPISTMECQSRPPSISISLTRHSSISDCRRTTGELIQLADVLRAVIVSCHPILTLPTMIGRIFLRNIFS